MKKIFPIIIVLISLFALTTNAQSVVSQELSVDTSKLDNFSYYFNEQQKIRKEQSGYFASDEEVKSWYYDSDHMTRENGTIKVYRDFNKYKLVSYPVKNKEIFNIVLRNAEMLFEYVYGEMELYSQRLLAKYNGKYYFNYNVNGLFDDLNANAYLSAEEKIEFISKWTMWFYDQDFEIIELTKTKEIFPGDSATIRQMPTDTGIISVQMYYVEYEAFYEGLAIYKHDTVRIESSIIGEKKHISSLEIFGVYLRGFTHNFQKVMTKDEIKGTGWLFNIKKNGTFINVQTQDDFRVYYYPENTSDNYTLHLSGTLLTSDPMQIRLCKVNGSTLNQRTVIWTSEQIDPYFNSGFNISNVVHSGFYVVEYLNDNNSWQLIDNSIHYPRILFLSNSNSHRSNS